MIRARSWSTLALAAALVVAGACGGGGSSAKDTTTTTAAAGATTTTAGPSHCTTDTKMDVYSTSGGPHTDDPGYKGPLKPAKDPVYTVDPPSGGDHLSQAAPPGAYEGANVVADGYYVHSLEHGYVVFWHRADLTTDQVTSIVNVAKETPKDVLVVARPSLTVPVAATAWGHRLLCDEIDLGALRAFALEFRNKGPEKIPH